MCSRSVPSSVWRKAVVHFREQVSQLLNGSLYKDPSHPIYNFIFQYYFTMNQKCLTHYSPGINVTLLDVCEGDAMRMLAPAFLDRRVLVDGCCLLTPSRYLVSEKKIDAMADILKLLKAVDNRQPSLCCYGLHEWAMVYRRDVNNNGSAVPAAQSTGSKKDSSRFQSLKLRLTLEGIRDVLKPKYGDESSPLRCTHFDATRFFTSDAKGLNSVNDPTPSRQNAFLLEQPGCVHVHMDLFKWAFKIYPFISSEVLLEAFALALRAREVDMRASPYDLYSYQPTGDYSRCPIHFNREPIMIETAEGKREYQKLQMELYRMANPVRKRIISCYDEILSDPAVVAAKKSPQ